jgi:hypothetical protein
MYNITTLPLLEWQIDHYTERLAASRAEGNIGAIALLRSQIYNFKQIRNSILN